MKRTDFREPEWKARDQLEGYCNNLEQRWRWIGQRWLREEVVGIA